MQPLTDKFVSSTILTFPRLASAMGPPASFSRARPGKPPTKKVRGFLSFPGEVRNQIYSYYFECGYRCEIAAKGSQFTQQKPKTVRLWAGAFHASSRSLNYTAKTTDEAPRTIRISRPLGKYSIVQGLQTNWFGSLFAINLVCKQIHAETLPFVYQKTTFVFDAPKRMLGFLNVVSNLKLEYITKLELHYTTYGNPQLSEHQLWQDLHGQSWIHACKTAARKLIGLHSLRIWIRVTNSLLRFNLREIWILPVLQFRRLTQVPTSADGPSTSDALEAQPLKLACVEVDFRTIHSGRDFRGNQPLAKASEDLHILFGEAIRLAILGAKEGEAMAGFNAAWEGEYAIWQYHLGYGRTGW
jgi:hypothetical protein